MFLLGIIDLECSFYILNKLIIQLHLIYVVGNNRSVSCNFTNFYNNVFYYNGGGNYCITLEVCRNLEKHAKYCICTSDYCIIRHSNCVSHSLQLFQPLNSMIGSEYWRQVSELYVFVRSEVISLWVELWKWHIGRRVYVLRCTVKDIPLEILHRELDLINPQCLGY